MHRNFYTISQKVNSIQAGLLRRQTKNGSITHHVLMKTCDDSMLICALTDSGKPDTRKLIGKRVNLIQKSENDYIYLSGIVMDKPTTNRRTLYIRLAKACWFVKKTKGSLSWLQEKYVYESIPLKNLGLAS